MVKPVVTPIIMLHQSERQALVYIGGYICRKIFRRNPCSTCTEILQTSEALDCDDISWNIYAYFNMSSRIQYLIRGFTR